MQICFHMGTKTKKQASTSTLTAGSKKTRQHRIEGSAVAGAIAGAAAGIVAGPAGAIAGGVLGGAAGAVAGLALSNAARERHARAAQLDKEIGVSDGDLGAPSLKHPPARVGAYSDAAAGASRDGSASPSEGPIQDVDV